MASRARVPGGGDFFAPPVSPSSAARHRRGFRGGWPSRSARWSTGRCRIAGRRHGGGGGSRRSCQAPTPVPARAGLPQAPHRPLDHRRAADRAEVRCGVIAASWGERRLEAVERLLRRSRVLPVDTTPPGRGPGSATSAAPCTRSSTPATSGSPPQPFPGNYRSSPTTPSSSTARPTAAHRTATNLPPRRPSEEIRRQHPPNTQPRSGTRFRGLNEFEHLPGMSVLGMPCGSGLTLDVACPSPEVSLAAP